MRHTRSRCWRSVKASGDDHRNALRTVVRALVGLRPQRQRVPSIGPFAGLVTQHHAALLTDAFVGGVHDGLENGSYARTADWARRLRQRRRTG